jgi:hypothetical protein
MMPWLRKWIPTVDVANPCCRVGWAVLQNGEDLIAFYKERSEAQKHQSSLGGGCVVAFGSNRIRSNDFIPRAGNQY